MSETRVYLVRHAEAQTNTTPELVAGLSSESPLTETGWRQPEGLRRRMGRLAFSPDVAYVSKAKRTKQTAKVTLGARALAAREDDRLNEMSQGGWEGEPREGQYTQEMLKGLKRDPLNYKARHPDGDGESKLEVVARFFSWMGEITEEHAGKSVMAFTHRMVIACAVAEIEGWPGEALDYRRFPEYAEQFDNASSTLIESSPSGLAVVYKGLSPDEFRVR